MTVTAENQTIINCDLHASNPKYIETSRRTIGKTKHSMKDMTISAENLSEQLLNTPPRNPQCNETIKKVIVIETTT